MRLRDLLFHCSAQKNAVFDKKLNSNRLSRSRVLYLMTSLKKKKKKKKKKKITNLKKMSFTVSS